MYFLLTWYVFNILSLMECAVLDPALYLQPSPPIKLSNSESTWSQSTKTNVGLPAENIKVSITNRETPVLKPRTFWPKLRTDYRLGGIHIPLTFSVSGLYGNYGSSKGTVATSYASLVGVETSKVPEKTRLSLISSNFNPEATVIRVYGSNNNKPTWSGWGNGKWGHYGKG